MKAKRFQYKFVDHIRMIIKRTIFNIRKIVYVSHNFLSNKHEVTFKKISLIVLIRLVWCSGLDTGLGIQGSRVRISCRTVHRKSRRLLNVFVIECDKGGERPSPNTGVVAQ